VATHDDGRTRPRPTGEVLDRAPDRLSVHHHRSAHPDLSVHHGDVRVLPGGPEGELAEHVVGCLELFGECAITLAGTPADLERWVRGPLVEREDVDTVPVLVVGAQAWAARTGGLPPPLPPARRVVVVCGGTAGAPGAAAVPVDPRTVQIDVERLSEVAGAVGEALAGQACTVVRVGDDVTRGT